MIEASCHCGAVRWQAPEPTELHTCDCSWCDRTGAIWTNAPEAEFRLLTMPERLAGYQFGHFMVRHYHCATCGLPTHLLSPTFAEDGTPDWDNMLMIWNVRMAPDFDRSSLPVTEVPGRTF
jgi:hypothetical protein